MWPSCDPQLTLDWFHLTLVLFLTLVYYNNRLLFRSGHLGSFIGVIFEGICYNNDTNYKLRLYIKETLFDAFSIYQTHTFENRNILSPNHLPENRYYSYPNCPQLLEIDWNLLRQQDNKGWTPYEGIGRQELWHGNIWFLIGIY